MCESPHEEEAKLRGRSCLKSLGFFQETAFLCSEVFTDAGSETGNGSAADPFLSSPLNPTCSLRTVHKRMINYRSDIGVQLQQDLETAFKKTILKNPDVFSIFQL